MRSFELSCILKGHNRCRKHKNIKFAVACNGETSPRSQIIVCHVAAVLCQGLELGRVWLPRHVTLPLYILAQGRASSVQRKRKEREQPAADWSATQCASTIKHQGPFPRKRQKQPGQVRNRTACKEEHKGCCRHDNKRSRRRTSHGAHFT